MSNNKASQLLQHLQRSEWVPSYDDDGVKQVIREIQALHGTIESQFAAHGSDMEAHRHLQCYVIVQHQKLLRNKRCLLTYLMKRAEQMKRLRWETGSLVPQHLQKHLSSREQEFFQGYDDILTEYMTRMDLDLTSDLQPPKDLYLEVRVLKDIRELYTESGPINLELNSTHYLRRSDVEHLIRQGHLMQV